MWQTSRGLALKFAYVTYNSRFNINFAGAQQFATWVITGVKHRSATLHGWDGHGPDRHARPLRRRAHPASTTSTVRPKTSSS